MTTRLPGSERTRETLNELINGRLRVDDAKSELVKLATRLIVEEGLEAEVKDALGRDYYEHGADPNGGYRNGVRRGKLKTAEGVIEYSAPQVAGTTEHVWMPPCVQEFFERRLACDRVQISYKGLMLVLS